MSISQSLDARDSLAGKSAKISNSKELANIHRAAHGTAVHCKECPKPALNANFCCVQFSNEMDGCIYGVSGPKSGGICSQVHQKRM